MDQVSHLDLSPETSATLVLAGVATMFRVKPRWSAGDSAIMRAHYPKGGLAAVRALLPHKTDGAIHRKARTLKLYAPGYQRQVESYFTSPHIDEAIRRYYHGTPRKGGLSKLAHQLRRPASWVSSRARQLGCVMPRFRDPPWSEDEVEILRRHAAKIPNTIARILRQAGYKRTAGAVSNKLVKLRCERIDENHYSATALAGLFGVSQHAVSNWIKKGWLTAKTKGTTREHDIFSIHVRDVRRFIVENVGSIDIRRVEKHWFIDLLANGT